MLRHKDLCVAWLTLHLLLIVSVSCRDMLHSVADGPTILPPSFKEFSEKSAAVISGALGQRLSASNPVREAVATYVNLAGIEAGYGYFAPNVPGTYKLTFELHYPDGRIEYELPHVSSNAARLRVAGLVNEIGRTKYDALREILVRMLAQSTWREHPDVGTMRALFQSIRLPNLNEFEQGKSESYEVLYTYDLTLADDR
jgi:hypothetical protein